jgi:group I intron endonuclease
MTIGIYILTNTVNQKTYVGQSWNIEQRLKSHKACRQTKYQIIPRAVQKYGWDNFNITIIPVFPESQADLDNSESLYIQQYNSIYPTGYNLKSGGNSSKHNNTTKQKISKSRKGHIHSTDTKLKISESNKISCNTPEFKRKMSIISSNRVRSDASKQKASITQKSKIFPGNMTPGVKEKLRLANLGKKWYTNGTTNIKTKETPPIGFVLGRTGNGHKCKF